MTSSLSPAQILGQPFTLPNGAVVKNRLAKSAMSEALGTTDNHVTEGLANLYRRWADGGIGLLITGNVMIDRRALGEPNNVALEDESDLELLKQWAAAGTRNGTQLWMQINHPGKQVPKGLNVESVAPSAIPFGKEIAAFFATPRELTEAEILDIIARFGRTAAIAQKAGFSGVQIHGAHGYLVSQFLSGHHNQRTDQWGGNAENRRRFVLEVFKAIRAQTGPDFPVGIKLNSADFQKGGFTEEESLDVIRALADAGIDLIEISGGTYEAPAMAGVKEVPVKDSTRRREAYFLEFAEKARQAVKTPLMVTGGFRTAEGMSEAITSGAVDFVGIARSLAIEPDAPNRLLSGQQPRHQVKPIKTGIKPIDKMALMEVAWYARQLRRMANGGEPKPNESGLVSFLIGMTENGWNTFKTRRLRA
ncbi:MAG TPA: NADH:flavin oxidoreductase/NADH oxidase family protein [Fluviicoccus sp.]|nr:NADH:flavin oxidoreductase/NADH oxidase family protein [Fluviicoccus sp.]